MTFVPLSNIGVSDRTFIAGRRSFLCVMSSKNTRTGCWRIPYFVILKFEKTVKCTATMRNFVFTSDKFNVEIDA